MLRSASRASLLCYLLLAVILPQKSYGFQFRSSSITAQPTSIRQHSRLKAAIIDPADIPAVLATAQHAIDLPVSILSAILTTSIVAPSPDALAHLHAAATATAIPMAKAATATAIPMAKAATTTIQEMTPVAGDAIQTQAQQAMDSGWKVIDATKFVHGGQPSFPGFSETKSIVAPHLLPGPSDEAVTMTDWPQNMFKARMEYVSTIIRAIQKLPYVAFGYVLLEFFFLRSGVDIYKEDVEDDPSGVLAETVSDNGVRVAIFFGLAVFTYIIS